MPQTEGTVRAKARSRRPLECLRPPRKASLAGEMSRGWGGVEVEPNSSGRGVAASPGLAPPAQAWQGHAEGKCKSL